MRVKFSLARNSGHYSSHDESAAVVFDGDDEELLQRVARWSGLHMLFPEGFWIMRNAGTFKISASLNLPYQYSYSDSEILFAKRGTHGSVNLSRWKYDYLWSGCDKLEKYSQGCRHCQTQGRACIQHLIYLTTGREGSSISTGDREPQNDAQRNIDGMADYMSSKSDLEFEFIPPHIAGQTWFGKTARIVDIRFDKTESEVTKRKEAAEKSAFSRAFKKEKCRRCYLNHRCQYYPNHWGFTKCNRGSPPYTEEQFLGAYRDKIKSSPLSTREISFIARNGGIMIPTEHGIMTVRGLDSSLSKVVVHGKIGSFYELDFVKALKLMTLHTVGKRGVTGPVGASQNWSQLDEMPLLCYAEACQHHYIQTSGGFGKSHHAVGYVVASRADNRPGMEIAIKSGWYHAKIRHPTDMLRWSSYALEIWKRRAKG